MNRPPASLLWFLYVAAGMGCPEIGRLLERDATTVRLWLVRAGVQTRARGSVLHFTGSEIVKDPCAAALEAFNLATGLAHVAIHPLKNE